ncbi:MAG: ATP-binding protein [Bacillota bacterium]|nr:ATP-binding protein [Bacillota bacterium]
MNYICERQFQSDLQTAQLVINEILSNIDERLDENHMFDIRLILNELISNCVIHGNQKDKTKQINLFFSLNRNKIKIKVSDEGKGFNIIHCKSDVMDENGRGLMLVKALSDKFLIKKNTITVLKRIN